MARKQQERRSKEEQREATRRKLLEVARFDFNQHGYGGASTERIVTEAGVTRGALYHHFSDKQGLFLAVFHEAQGRIAAAVQAAVEAEADPWVGMVAGCHAFLEAAVDPTIRRIVLLDGPAVIGTETWRRLDIEYSSNYLQEGIEALMKAGYLPALSPAALTALLAGAMNEASRWIAEENGSELALEESKAALSAILEALRAKAKKGSDKS